MGVYVGFFARRTEIKLADKSASTVRLLEYKNVDGLVAYAIRNRLATLKELQTFYTLEDLFLMWEAHFIPEFNSMIVADAERRKAQCQAKR